MLVEAGLEIVACEKRKSRGCQGSLPGVTPWPPHGTRPLFPGWQRFSIHGDSQFRDPLAIRHRFDDHHNGRRPTGTSAATRISPGEPGNWRPCSPAGLPFPCVPHGGQARGAGEQTTACRPTRQPGPNEQGHQRPQPELNPHRSRRIPSKRRFSEQLKTGGVGDRPRSVPSATGHKRRTRISAWSVQNATPHTAAACAWSARLTRENRSEGRPSTCRDHRESSTTRAWNSSQGRWGNAPPPPAANRHQALPASRYSTAKKHVLPPLGRPSRHTTPGGTAACPDCSMQTYNQGKTICDATLEGHKQVLGERL